MLFTHCSTDTDIGLGWSYIDGKYNNTTQIKSQSYLFIYCLVTFIVPLTLLSFSPCVAYSLFFYLFISGDAVNMQWRTIFYRFDGKKEHMSTACGTVEHWLIIIFSLRVFHFEWLLFWREVCFLQSSLALFHLFAFPRSVYIIFLSRLFHCDHSFIVCTVVCCLVAIKCNWFAWSVYIFLYIFFFLLEPKPNLNRTEPKMNNVVKENFCLSNRFSLSLCVSLSFSLSVLFTSYCVLLIQSKSRTVLPLLNCRWLITNKQDRMSEKMKRTHTHTSIEGRNSLHLFNYVFRCYTIKSRNKYEI